MTQPHVFVSYKSDDRDAAQHIVIGLRQAGLEVWWDQSLEAGDRFSDEIDRQVRAAHVVLVLWSSRAVASRWVNAEAEIGDSQGKLVALRLEECTPLVPFNAVQAPLLAHWTGDRSDERWVALLATVERRVRARTADQRIDRRPADPLVGYRTMLEASLNVVPQVFRNFGPEHLSEVYVEVRLSGERRPDAGAPFPDLASGRRSSIADGAKLRLREVLDRPEPCWALLGSPGSGKTTLLRQLALELLDARTAVPILLRAADLRASDTLTTALQRSEWSSHTPALLAEVERGRAVVMIDGLDEHAAPDSDGLRTAVVRMSADAPSCKVVVTSRPIGYRSPSPRFHRLDLCPLEPAARRALLSRWVTDPDRVTRTLARMERSVQLRRLAENPLLLTLVGIVLFDPDTELPLHRTALYERVIQTLLGGGHAPDRPKLSRPELVRTALEELALRLHDDELLEVPLDGWITAIEQVSVHPELVDHWGTPQAFLAEVASRSGLLVPYPNARRVRGYLSPHRSLREYLAACAVHRALTQRRTWAEFFGFARPSAVDDVLTRAKTRPGTWAEVLALTSGLLPLKAADDLVRRVVATGSQELTLRVISDAERIKPETVYEVLRVEGGQSNWDDRRRVLQEDLPRLVGASPEPARRVMGLLQRFAQTTTHGADLWWCCHLLGELGRGRCGELDVPESVRGEASELAERFWMGHRPDEREAATAALLPQWRTIPAGRFRMGSPEDEAERYVNEGPQHEVEVTAPFAMTAVTVPHRLYERFDPKHRSDRGEGEGDDHPAANVTWYEAAAFAAWLGVRLPTEVEWEYACRAGTTTRFWSGDDEADLAAVGWYDGNSDGHAHPVGERPANPWGLHDVHGNVWEWCADEWDGNRYAAQASETSYRHDPTAPLPLSATGVRRVARGGAFGSGPRGARSAFRNGGHPGLRGSTLGFRLVRASAPSA